MSFIKNANTLGHFLMNDTPICRFDEKPPLWVFDEKPFR